MNLKEHIRRILKEEVNESTFFRRRVDMRLMEKEFFDILNILTDIYLSKYNHGIDFNFETFEDHVIHYFMDGYYNDLTNDGENDYPYDEVYEFLSNHFHNKIKDRYDTHFGCNINESIRRILKEETDSIKNLNESKTLQHLKIINNLLEPLKEEDCICDTRVSFDVEDAYYDVYLVFSQKELHEKFSNVMGIRNYITEMMNDVKNDLEAFLPIRNIFIGYYTKPNCEWSPLNESEDDKEKNLNVLRELISMFDYSEVCDMWVEYDPEDGYYIIRSKMSTKNHNTKALEKEFEFLEESIKSLDLKAYISNPYWVEECEDKNELNESEDKNQSLLSLIEEHGLYEFMKMAGLSLPQIYTKTGELPKEVFERFIKDFIKQEGYPSWMNGTFELIFAVEIQKNIQIENFYLEGDKVTVEIRGYDDYNQQTDGYIESLSNLSDDEIFTIVENMINFTNHTH